MNSPFARHLQAAQGYLELGLPHDAWDELEAIEPANRRAEIPVLGLRVSIYQAWERWGGDGGGVLPPGHRASRRSRIVAPLAPKMLDY